MLALTLAVAVVVAPARADGVGVVWSEATVDPETRQRVLAALGVGSGAGARVVDDADLAARRVVAYEVDRPVVDRQRQRLADIERAEAAYRAGDPARARAEADAVLTSAREDPQAPGLVPLLVRAHLLRAQVLWTEGGTDEVDEALRAALILDPDARVGTRRMRPDLVARHEALRAELLATQARWTPPHLVVGDAASIEVDGVAGARPVPPGEHVVVVRRPGAAPVGAFVRQDWTPPDADERLPVGLPDDAAQAERICDALSLGALLMVRTRDDRAAVQQYRCGDGFVAPWYGAMDELDRGVVAADSAGRATAGVEQALADDARWPVVTVVDAAPRGTDPPTSSRPWWRRAWVWGIIGGVVVGGVVTGAVLGTREPPQGYVVDGDSFLRR